MSCRKYLSKLRRVGHFKVECRIYHFYFKVNDCCYDMIVHYTYPLDHRQSKRVPEKHLFLLYWLCQSLWLCGSQETVENSERDGNTDHLTCLLRNLYAGQEATVRTGYGTTDWFQRGKGVLQGCILSPCLFNFYAEYIMRNTGLDEAQAGIKIARKNINNLRYADDTILMEKVKKN